MNSLDIFRPFGIISLTVAVAAGRGRETSRKELVLLDACSADNYLGDLTRQKSGNALFFENSGAPGIDRTVVMLVACRPVMQVVKLCGKT